MKVYSSSAAFRQALERRLHMQAEEESVDLMRFRRQVAFDRFLARIFSQPSAQWALKGGYALELRFEKARTTRDVDLTLYSVKDLPEADDLAERLHAELQILAGLDIGDFFHFEISPVTMRIEAAPYGGGRFPAHARLGGRTFARFHVDVGVGDVVIEPSEVLIGRDWLGFADISPPAMICISKEQQFAEKLHAYSAPERSRTNSRVKDLVDMVLMIRRSDLDFEQLQRAIDLTFTHRLGHVLPDILAPPPDGWEKPFSALSAELGMKTDIESAYAEVSRFLQVIRGG